MLLKSISRPVGLEPGLSRQHQTLVDLRGEKKIKAILISYFLVKLAYSGTTGLQTKRCLNILTRGRSCSRWVASVPIRTPWLEVASLPWCHSLWQEPFLFLWKWPRFPEKWQTVVWRVSSLSGQQQVIRNTAWSSAMSLVLEVGLLPSCSLPQDLNYWL